MPSNLLENSGFENKLTGTYAHWKGWYYDGESICVSQKKQRNAQTGFFQDIPAGRFKSNGTYGFQMKLLTPTANVWVKPTIWVVKPRNEGHVEQEAYDLKAGIWQFIHVTTYITRRNLKRVRAELYFGPNNREVIIQSAYFGKW